MSTQISTATHQTPSAPGPELSALARGVLVIQGSSLPAVCRELGVHKSSARACLSGHWKGPDAFRLIHVLCKRAGVPAPETVPDPRGWLSSREFASQTGLHLTSAIRVLRKAFEGRPWRGTQLAVRRIPNNRWGRHYSYQVDPESLPAAVRDGYATRLAGTENQA